MLPERHTATASTPLPPYAAAPADGLPAVGPQLVGPQTLGPQTVGPQMVGEMQPADGRNKGAADASLATTAPKRGRDARQPLNLLCYVHLRNIHGSTGAGRVARQLTEHLGRREDVRLRLLADARDHARVVPLVGEPWSGYPVHTFSSDTSRQQARWFALDRPQAESFWPEAQVVFCTGESYVPRRRARLVVTAHDAAFFEASAHRRDAAFWRQQAKWRLLFGRIEAEADLVHTVSGFSAERLAHFFPGLRSRLCVVPNAVTARFFDPPTAGGLRFVAAQELDARPFVLLPGGLHFRKNADLVLEAVPRLLAAHPELVLVVVNHSDPAYAGQAAALGPRLRLLGFVEDEALQALYRTAAAVWFPSRYEGFGMPVLEAMAAGTPVVASDASSLPEIAGGAALLAAPSAAGDHVEKLAAVLGDSRLHAELAAAGRERSRSFTWDRSAAQLRENFEALL